jgi:diguanylate cyclase (GGDEF)-like protein
MVLVDEGMLGVGRPLALITCLRLGTLIPLWILWRLGQKRSTFRALEWSVLMMIIWWGITNPAIMILNPAARFYIVMMGTVTAVLLGAVDIISSRITVTSWVVWVLLNLFGCVLSDNFSTTDLVGLASALVMSGLVGRLMARRGNQLSRRNYLLLRESETARAALEDAHRRLEKSQAELARIVATDTLTGAAARQEFMNRGAAEMRQARQAGKPLGILVLDIDHFKSINDGHGHASGDAALVAFVKALMSGLHGRDCLGRVGGEEFAVLLPETAETQVALVAERLREKVADILLDLPRGTLQLTVSIGGAALTDADTSIEALIARADKALYAAKRGGRNRVIMVGSPEYEALRNTVRLHVIGGPATG